MTIKQKIQSLIAAANTKTGESDATLTDAVQTLVDGYGQGGGTSITVVPLTVAKNGTTTASEGRAYSPVTVNVAVQAVKIFNGTLSQPIPSDKFSAVKQLIANGKGFAKIVFSFSGVVIEAYLKLASYAYIDGCDLSSGAVSTAAAYSMSWNSDGSCTYAKMLSQGSIVDVLAYAPSIETQVAVFSTTGTVI